MPRPKKWRRVCGLPKVNKFGPLGMRGNTSFITMTVDEYETVRLIDLEGLKQEECAINMNVGRTTVQSIYESARKKIADSLINGKKLIIEGGEFRLCGIETQSCGRRNCYGRNTKF